MYFQSTGQLYVMGKDSPDSGEVYLRGYLKTVGYGGEINVPLSDMNFDLNLKDQGNGQDEIKFADVAKTTKFRLQATRFSSLKTMDPKVNVCP